MLNRCKAEDGLSKAGNEEEREQLEPLVKEFDRTTNDCLVPLNASDENYDEMIEILNAHMGYIELK